MPLSVLAAYQEKIRTGELQPDPAQARGAEALARLEGELNALGEPGLLSFLRRRADPRGVYLWGPVGRGKSMLMDLFFASAPAERRRRVHFHAFMAEAHDLIGLWRRGSVEARRARFGQARGDDPIPPVAAALADQARLLCFDEFVVVDIADAMILGRLFEALFARGVVVVATSNRAPDELYKDGLNRQLFLPFIELLKSRLEVVEMDGPKDFRLGRIAGARAWFSPATEANRRAFDDLWERLISGDAERAARVEVLGRTLRFERASGARLRVGFEELCGAALGPSDYLALVERFSTLFLEGVPRLSPERRNEAVRFTSLVDVLYEAGAALAVLAEGEPSDLYPEGDRAFEFQRTASRLEEMRSKAWLDRAGTRP